MSAPDIIGGILMGQVRCWRALGRAMCLVLTMTAMSGAAQVGADAWQGPAADLARQIAGITGPGVVSLSVKNISAVRAEEVPRIQGLLVKELAGAGVQVKGAADANDAVRVTLSQAVRQGVWVAEVQQGPEVRVTMVTVAQPAAAAKARDSEVVLTRKLMLARAEPVLDAAEGAGADGRQRLVVLGPEDVTFYSAGAGEVGMSVTAKVTLQHERPFPRDVRGRLEVNEQGWKAYLPGVVCGGGTDSPKDVSCAESDDPWPLAQRRALFHAGRNFFTGVTMPPLGGDAGPFYSEADLATHGRVVSVVSAVSGGFRVADGGGIRPLSGTRDWGSDIAGMSSGCGSGVQVLASAAGDGEQDTLVAYEIDGTQAVAASAALTLGGHVTAMWAAAGGGATVITEKAEPRSYEVYRVAATCGS